jgi:hypothetical protein
MAVTAPPCGTCRNEDHVGSECPFKKWRFKGQGIRFAVHTEPDRGEGTSAKDKEKAKKRKQPDTSDTEEPSQGSSGTKRIKVIKPTDKEGGEPLIAEEEINGNGSSHMRFIENASA